MGAGHGLNRQPEADEAVAASWSQSTLDSCESITFREASLGAPATA